MRKLKVRGVPHVNVSNPHTVSQRYVGRNGDGPCDEVIDDHPDLRYALKHGDLLPCDELTAKLAGIRFDAKAAKPALVELPKGGAA